MNKYCTNCGNKLDSNADICLKCGKFINKVPNNNKKMTTEEIFSIVGMVLGIIGFLIMLIFSLGLSEVRYELINEDIFIRLLGTMFFMVIPLSSSIPGLILSIIGERKKKSVYGMVGLISSLLAVLFIIASFIYIIW